MLFTKIEASFYTICLKYGKSHRNNLAPQVSDTSALQNSCIFLSNPAARIEETPLLLKKHSFFE